MKFSHSFLVSADDIDEQEHVNNVAYVRWIQNIAVAHWFHETTAERQEKYTWVLLRHEIDYKKPSFEGEKITATTWVGNWTAVTCERFTEIYRGSDLLVKSRAIWCMIDRKTNKPTRIGEDLKKNFRIDMKI